MTFERINFIKSEFHRLAPTGPMLVLAGMKDPDHSKTNTPLTGNSPLIRLALIAADKYGVENIVFDPSLPHSTTLTFGEKDPTILDTVSQEQIPRFSYWHEMLNDVMLVGWVGFGQEKYSLDDEGDGIGDHWYGESRVKFDPSNESHQRVVRLVLTHFEEMGYKEAASRLRSELRNVRIE